MNLIPYPCPWCGEPNRVWTDPSGGAAQEMVEDCRVCCRPIVLRLAQTREEETGWRLCARREGEE